jgi:hypothetical protein
LLTSLSQCEGHHSEKQHKEGKRVPTEIPDDGGGALLFHGFIQLLAARSNSLVNFF